MFGSILNVITHTPPVWTVIPFILLLSMIVAGPLFFPHFWHKRYKAIAIVLGVLVLGYYLIVLHDLHTTVETFVEYISFIALLGSLFVVAGGIYIHADYKSLPATNVGFLIFGSVIANLIGTTGAAMLLIRPWIRLNKYKLQPYHLIFFIFMVCNVGGLLTPIGDPPLFLGFLKGVPFGFTLVNLSGYWALAIALLAIMFYIRDKKNKQNKEAEAIPASNKIVVEGIKNVFWLAIVIVAVFIDPNVYEWVPYIDYHGAKISYIREIVQLSSAFICFKMSNRTALASNEFNFEPILEVVYIFFGIFLTMMPALSLIAAYAQTPEGSARLSLNAIYWVTGILSSFLDNAPTYLNFLSAAMAKYGLNINVTSDVLKFATETETAAYLMVISISSVFFGACTYLGNGPNFMVRSIAENSGIKMPSFLEYIYKFVIPYLVPILFLIYFILL
jgi:Na+/H+ antiporter NhaD/arsenite permease-like protein